MYFSKCHLFILSSSEKADIFYLDLLSEKFPQGGKKICNSKT